VWHAVCASTKLGVPVLQFGVWVGRSVYTFVFEAVFAESEASFSLGLLWSSGAVATRIF
jgi:hypothetical protein